MATRPALPSQTYDHVWIPAGKPTEASRFVTSDQCIGCHSAGGTGLQFHMTEPGPQTKLSNMSPYGSWRKSPMGLSGRDPIFFAQLASEIETFHPESSTLIQDTCMSCHAVQGHRQHAIDGFAQSGECDPLARAALDAVPYPPGNPMAGLAHYAALGRDGVSCTTCHSMVLGADATEKVKDAPQNACVKARQELINPGLTGLAKTFTGNFLVANPGEIFGPFKDPKKKPMEHATGLVAAHSELVKSSEICASCHTVHLPVLHGGKIIGHTYEQATYPEWAFSSYRTGETVDGPLPEGPGAKAQSCQGCHMPNKDARGKTYRSKIATIQEASSFPQAEYTLPAEDIDLEPREGFAKHTLVGLNMFLTKMAQQFPDVLGIRTEDPMLPSHRAVDPLTTTERAMIDQAERTAAIDVSEVARDGDTLTAKVRVTNKAGHKFPTGVAFRRAFIAFSVVDKDGTGLWASGRTNGKGVIVDETGKPIAGELWWTAGCGARIDPQARAHQPHYQVITKQTEAQIYQEMPASPGDAADPSCGAQREAGRPAHLELPLHLRQGEGQPPPAARLPAARPTRRDRRGARRQGRPCRGRGAGRRGRRPGLCGNGRERRRRHGPLSGPPRRDRGRARGGPRDPLLSGDPALLPPGALLHRQERGHQTALLSGRQARYRGRPDPELEAESGPDRQGKRSLRSCRQ